VTKSGVALEKDAILDYLVGNGYTGTRKYAKLVGLTRQAKALRERDS
jgi:hypothetical protein